MMIRTSRTYATPDTTFEDWKSFDAPPALRPVTTYTITPEMRANDERQRREREAARANVWPIKATLSIENLKRERSA